MDWSHLPHDVLGAALRSTGSGALVARAAAVCTSWRAAAHQRELWADLAAVSLGVAPAFLAAGSHPKDVFVDALTSEAWVWGILPHGGPCPLPGGDTCAASLMAHTASGSRCVAPMRLTAAPPAAAAVLIERCGRAASAEADSEPGAAAAAALARTLPLNARYGPVSPPRGAAAGPSGKPQGPAAAAGPRRAASPRAVAAGEDFVVVLGAGGRLWDSRHAAKHRHPGVKLADVGAALRGVVVTAIAAGRHHVLALSDAGDVFGWGACGAGQLGVGHRRPWVPAPQDLTRGLRAEWEAASAPVRVAAIAAGAEHSGLLTSSGDVLLAGQNASGECARRPAAGARDACVDTWARAELPDGAGRPALLALGWRNTVIVTTAGRLLVCGDNTHGQCTPGAAGGSSVPAVAATQAPAPGDGGSDAASAAAVACFVDAGPDGRWNGMARRGQRPDGGGGEAADRVVAAAVGRACVYALTEKGDVFQWGAAAGGSGGARGAAAAPARVLGVKGARSIVASAAGRFAAAVDDAGRLFTWGTGKAGQLGLNSTSKATTAREVKALRGLRVTAVACGTDHCCAVTAWRPPRRHCPGLSRASSGVSAGGCDDGGESPGGPHGGDRSGRRRGGGRGGGRSSAGGGGWPGLSPAGGSGGGGCGLETQPPERSNFSQHACSAALPGTAALTAAYGAPGGRCPGGGCGGGVARDAGCAPSGACSSGDRAAAGDSGRACSSASGGDRGGGRGGRAGRRRWSKGSKEGDGASDSGDECAARGARQERGVNFAVKRLLKAFVNDPRQREITLPEALTSSDRYRLHVVAEEWGLGHESRGEGAARAMTLWKPSRTRRGGSCGGGSGGGGGGGSGGGEAIRAGAVGEELRADYTGLAGGSVPGAGAAATL